MSDIDLDALMTDREAAEFMGVTRRFMQARRQRGGGPKFVRISSRVVRYRRQDLLDWIEERVKTSTKDGDA